MAKINLNRLQAIKSLSPQELSLCNRTHINVCNTWHKQVAIFTFQHKFFLQDWLTQALIPQRFYFSANYTEGQVT